MEKLIDTLDAFFSAFESTEAFDFTAFKEAVQQALEPVKEQMSQYAGLRTACDNAVEENALLRHSIIQDCRAKLLLLGDKNADHEAEMLEFFTAEELLNRRDLILQRYDSRFRVEPQNGNIMSSGLEISPDQNRVLKELGAYQLQ